MTKPKNKFSYIMWALFTGLLAVLFFSSTREFLDGISALDAAYNNIITVLIGVIAVEIVILFDNLIKRGNLYSGEKKYKMYGMIGFTISIISFFVIRILSAATTIDYIESNNLVTSVYEKSMIGSDGRIYCSFISVNAIYDTVVSLCFKFLGNCPAGIFVADVLLSFICFILIYFAIKALYGRMEAFVCTFGFAILPLFTGHITGYANYLMEFVVFAFGLYLVSVAKRLFAVKAVSVVAVIVSAMAIGILYLYDDVCIGLIFLMLVLILEEDNFSILLKAINTLLCLALFAVGFVGSTVYEAFACADPGRTLNDIINLLVYRWVSVFNYEILYEYAKDNMLLIVFIACIVYSVMFLRCRFDEAHSMIMLFLITAAAMCYLDAFNESTYSLVCTFTLLVIAGAGIKKLVMSRMNKMAEEEADIAETEEEADSFDSQIIDLDTTSLEDITDDEEPECLEELTGEEWAEVSSGDEKLSENMEEVEEVEDVEDNKEDDKIELFINPLPLPGKGTKKEVKYDYEVSDEDMHYDFELTEENDFYDVV